MIKRYDPQRNLRCLRPFREMMGADRTSVKNVGNRIPEPIQGGH